VVAAADGIGRVDTARLHLARAVSLGQLANDTLARSVGLPKEVRLLALWAWRSTHRSPEHLAQRREISEEAFNTEKEPVAPKSGCAVGMIGGSDQSPHNPGGCDQHASRLL
jgi:hypothetical protein